MADAVIAIVGRPNVGKSTLFNRLVGRREAIVDDRPGVTRDRREGAASLGGAAFTVVDTAGLEDAPAGALEAAMRRQTEAALAGADAALFLIDARAGVTALDRHFAAWLRRGPAPVILAANKAESGRGMEGAFEAYELGFGAPVAISAEHGEGLAGLYEALAPFVETPVPEDDEEEDGDEDDDGDDEAAGPLKLAIVGRPNVGKSTLINRLLGEDRLLTGPEPGVTRDAIAVEMSWKGRPVRLVDTAGLRRRARVQDRIERLSAADTDRAIRFAEVVVLLLDSADGLERQDLSIAARTVEEGRALVLAANKWDLVRDAPEVLGALRDRIETSLPQVRDVPLLTVSAASGRGVDRLVRTAFESREIWSRRIPTGALNRWLREALEAHPPPIVKGRRLKLRYASQIKRRPPTVAIFGSRPSSVPESYVRYLANGLRRDFDLPGVPIRILLRAGANPYAEDGQQ